VITYSPVGGGVLSGKYGPGKRPDSGRIVENPQYTSRYREEWVYETAAAFTQFANARGVHPVSLAVAWVAANPDVTCPIVGARSLEQLTPSLESLQVEMTAPLHAEIAALSRTPPPATDRLEDQ
jgi:aryl-alcohol dehydrogenase-like predicted oxidoreductase